MTVGYTLRSGLQSGRIDAGEYGEHAITDSSLDVEDYDTAAALVERFGHLYWPGGDPGGPDADGDDSDDDGEVVDATEADEPNVDVSEPDPEAEVDGGGDSGGEEPVDFDADRWLADDYEHRAARVRDGEVDAHLDAIESADRSNTVLEAVEARRSELEG